jgi:tripartite-type tricarboxylate transporter receptor subunit TctC
MRPIGRRAECLVKSTTALLGAAIITAACSSGAAPAAPKNEAPTAAPAAASSPAAAAAAASSPAAAAAKPSDAASTDAPKPAANQAATAGGADFKGKTVRINVGYPPGGGFDFTARLLAPYLAKALPGEPTVIVDNQPGADSLLAAKTVLSSPIRPNEYTIVVYIASLLTKSNLAGGLEGFAIEKESAYLGKPDAQASPLGLCAHKSVVKDLDEFLARKEPIKVSALTGSSNYDVYLRWAKEVGYPIEMVTGYQGTAQMGAAFNRDEVDATPACRDLDIAQNPDWMAEDKITPLFYFAVPAQALKQAQAEGKYPWYKSVLDVKPVTSDQRAALENFNVSAIGSNIYAMSKQTPAPVLEAFRAAIKQVATNPEFVRDMDGRTLPVGYQSPQEIEQNIADLEKLTPAGRELLKKMLAL